MEEEEDRNERRGHSELEGKGEEEGIQDDQRENLCFFCPTSSLSFCLNFSAPWQACPRPRPHLSISEGLASKVRGMACRAPFSIELFGHFFIFSDPISGRTYVRRRSIHEKFAPDSGQEQEASF
ncbi:hypothetical protein Mapa_003744 [Marchantia paleacea]|nr:hypothetical protein Mapa_003744 [Marchantia paleacea]